jgi:hypothetical protein
MADLTTLENVKNTAQVTDTTADVVLQRLISAFSQWFLTQVNRGALIEASYTEQRNGSGGDSITTLQYPIMAVTSLTVGGVSISPSDGMIPGYIFDDFTIWLNCSRFCRGRGNIQIVYTAGYATVPLDIEQAIIDQVLFTWKREKRLGTMTESNQGLMTTSYSQRDLAPGVQMVINAYRDRAVVGL